MLEALSGRDWAQLAPVLRAPPSAQTRATPTSSFARLPEEDMDLFGLAPTSDPLLLVVCSRCARHIKASRFAGHFERCSKREEEDKMPPKRMRLEVTEDDAVLPTDSPKRSTTTGVAPGKA